MNITFYTLQNYTIIKLSPFQVGAITCVSTSISFHDFHTILRIYFNYNEAKLRRIKTEELQLKCFDPSVKIGSNQQKSDADYHHRNKSYASPSIALKNMRHAGAQVYKLHNTGFLRARSPYART
jgi:hypothetical protein